MGVRGLQTYLERYCPDACYQVHLPTIISDYQSKYGPPEIVVDTQSCLNMWHEGLDWTIGLEVQEIVERVRMFVEAFTKLGAKLTFFMGGLTPEKKRKTWTSRRISSMQNIMEVFDMYYKGKTFDDIPPELSSIPVNMGHLVSIVLKYGLKCEVFTSDDECDEEIIDYVHENGSFAIFGQDTDFVISDVNCLVLSAKNFNIHGMTTLLYDRQKLSNNLNITKDQLPFFAILIGNDLLPQELLKPFHSELCGWRRQKFIPYQVLMPAVGNYISELPHAPVDELLKIICQDVFRNYFRLNEMKISYNSYLIHQKPTFTPTDTWSRILHVAVNRMRVGDFSSVVHGILKYRVFECSMTMEDFRRTKDSNRDPRDKPSATVLRPMRLRLYGILFFEQRYQKPSLTEWCGENLDSYHHPLVVQPEYPKAHHPGLLALWDEKKADKHARHKWVLFLKAVSPRIENVEAWSSLKEEMIVPVAACFYLLEEKYMSTWELHAILTTIAIRPLYDCARLRSFVLGCPNIRAIQLTVTFIRTCTCVCWLLSACGYPVPLSERTAFYRFEAKLFQMVYQKAEKTTRFEELCEENEPCLKTFLEMKSLITTQPCIKWRNNSKPTTNFGVLQNPRRNAFSN